MLDASARRFWAIFLVAISFGLTLPELAHAQDRRNRKQPGLILETGGRHATCDALTFTPKGDFLLAAGDDKVVRIWGVDAQLFRRQDSQTLRWSIYREQRGGIFAMALSPDASRVVVGGFGLKTGCLAVINRATGAIENALKDPPTADVTWVAAYSLKGRYVVYGTEKGGLYRWDLLRPNTKPTAAAPNPTRFGGSAGAKINRVRLIAFLDDTRFLSVAQDGLVREWDLTRPATAARVISRPIRAVLPCPGCIASR